LEGASLFDWIQIFALNVFDERKLQRLFVANLAHDDRYAQ
jgi:hypothetical protein